LSGNHLLTAWSTPS